MSFIIVSLGCGDETGSRTADDSDHGVYLPFNAKPDCTAIALHYGGRVEVCGGWGGVRGGGNSGILELFFNSEITS